MVLPIAQDCDNYFIVFSLIRKSMRMGFLQLGQPDIVEPECLEATVMMARQCSK